MAKGEYRSEIPKEKPDSPGLMLRVVLVLAVIAMGAAFLVARYVGPGNPEQTSVLQTSARTPAQDRRSTIDRVATEDSGNKASVVVYRGKFGQFLARGWIDGEEIVFVVDTGASHVVLSPDDAGKIGLKPPPDKFTVTAQTASGSVKAAPVRLRRVSLGPINVDDVDALINVVPMGYSLLGLSFLNRLEKVEVRGSQMTLTQ